MEHRQLGNSGLTVSLVGIGCNNFGGRADAAQSQIVIKKALDLGITLFDTADVYGGKGGSETILGDYLGVERQNIVLATKFGWDMSETDKGASRRYIYKAIHASLKRLKTDYIDLYQLHKPDPLTPIAETLRAMSDLVKAGAVRYIGCSNLKSWQVIEAVYTAKELGLEGFISCQDEYSLVMRDAERELLPAMKAYGLGLLPYFPLASGLLSGKYKRDAPLPEGARLTKSQGLAADYLTKKNWAIVEKLEVFCANHNRSILELAFSWLAANPVTSSIIAGATKPEQLEQNVAAVNWKLSQAELEEVQKILEA
jgi:aryl-alcohol dehydrogenase-like predicted oxidoreductase